MKNASSLFDIRADAPCEDIISLWHGSFGDSPQVISDILSSFDNQNNLFAGYENGLPVCSLCAVPVTLRGFHGSYILAACVDEKMRGKGIFRRFFESVLDILRSRGEDFAFLIPASESLFGMYGKFGFTHVIGGMFSVIGKGFALEKTDKTLTPFDGDYDRLFKIYLSYGDAMKSKPLFVKTLSDYEKNIFYTSDGGYAVIRDGGGVLQLFAPDIPRFAPKKKALLKRFTDFDIPENLLSDIFFEE